VQSSKGLFAAYVKGAKITSYRPCAYNLKDTGEVWDSIARLCGDCYRPLRQLLRKTRQYYTLLLYKH
jgi:hypothetical protein